jgi:uncharacterized protein YkwD
MAGLLTACGGGGGDAPAAPEAPEAPAVTATCGLADFEASVIARVNQLRAAGADCRSGGNFGPAAALTWNDRLAQAAAGHSQDMADLNYFSHTSQDGRTLGDRATEAGYAWSTVGENIAAGYSSVNGVMDAWMESDGHCANIMKPDFTEVGVACVPGTASNTYSSYWTMNLGRPR